MKEGTWMDFLCVRDVDMDFIIDHTWKEMEEKIIQKWKMKNKYYMNIFNVVARSSMFTNEEPLGP